MMAFADYDLDGDLDAYLVTNRLDPTGSTKGMVELVNGKPYIREQHRELVDVITPEDGRTRVIRAGQYDHFYENMGDGTFREITKQAGFTGNYWGLNAIWWDFNRDGRPDIYVSNDYYGPDQLYQNNGDGTFTDRAADLLPHTPWYSMGTDVADLNNDGWLDLMGSDMAGTNHYKQKVSMGDMNTTGWFLTHPTPRQYMRNALFINTGRDRFLEVAYLAGVANTDWTWSLKFADFDEDGRVDLYVTNGMNRDWVNTDLRSLSNSKSTPDAMRQVWLDAAERDDANLAFRNDGDLKLTPVGAAWGLDENQVSYGAAVADLDQDGDLDLVVNNSQSAPSLYRNNSANGHRISVRLKGDDANSWGVGATVKIVTPDGLQQTRHITSSQGYMSSNDLLVHFGTGQNKTIQQLTVTWPGGKTQSFQNLGVDQFYEIQQATAEAPGLTESEPASTFRSNDQLLAVRHRETPFDDYQRQPLLPMQHSQLGPGMAWSDVDGDGDDDVYVGGAAGHAGQLFINTSGTFEPRIGPWESDAQSEDMGVLFFDADQDSDLDLYVVSGGVECEPGAGELRDRLYLNDGSGIFVRSTDRLPDNADSGSCVVAADYDHDGDLDLFVGGRVIPGKYPLSPKSRLLQNQDGQFVDVSASVAPQLREAGMVTAAIWSDVDLDGWLDLMVSYDWGPIRLFKNELGNLVDRTSEAGLNTKFGWFNSIIPCDVNGDEAMDYVVGNVGLNTKYHANDHHPTQIYCGDFDGSGNLRLIEAEYEADTLFPVRGKSCSTNAMPFLGGKFTKFHDFAIADLNQIYTEEKLEAAEHFSANWLSSSVLINDGSGRFESVALPRLAQVAPCFGIVTGDFNGDRLADLCLAQNFFGPQRETGRMDGGCSLLLYGKGDGSFECVTPIASGIVVPGDAKSLTMTDADMDGRVDLVFGINDGWVQSFAAQTNSDTFAVGLRGDVAGARVTIEHHDGFKQSAEWTLGSGYLSQSSPIKLFGGRDDIARIVVRWPTGEEETIEDMASNSQNTFWFEAP